jgi:hypothetical protein
MDVMLCIYECDLVYGCYVEQICWILCCLNKCVRFGCVYRCTVYYVRKLYRFCNSSCVGYTVSYNFFKA